MWSHQAFHLLSIQMVLLLGTAHLSADISCAMYEHRCISGSRGRVQWSRWSIRKLLLQCHLLAARARELSANCSWKKKRRLGRERGLHARSISLSCSSHCTQLWPVAPARVQVSTLKIGRLQNIPWHKEHALLFLGSRGISWTHFLFLSRGDQQEGNSCGLLGPGGSGSLGGHCTAALFLQTLARIALPLLQTFHSI